MRWSTTPSIGRADDGALQIDARLIQPGPGGDHVGMRLHSGVFEQDRVGPPSAGGGPETRLRCGDARLGLRDRGARLSGHRLRVGIFLLRDGARTGEDGASALVKLRLLKISLSPYQIGPDRVHLGRADTDLACKIGVVREDLPHLPLRPSERRLGLLDRKLEIGVVDLHEHLARMHGLRVVDEHLGDRAAHQRRHLGDLHIRIGIFG